MFRRGGDEREIPGERCRRLAGAEELGVRAPVTQNKDGEPGPIDV